MNAPKRSCALLLIVLISFGLLLAFFPPYREATRSLVSEVDRRYLDRSLARLLTAEPADSPALALEAPPPDSGAYRWASGDPLVVIGHRLGPVGGSGWNRIETFRKGRRLGFRLFEVDLAVTAEDSVVCYHGRPGEDLDGLTFRAYLETVGADCRFSHLLQLAQAHPEVRFVLDVKNRIDEAYDLIEEQTAEPPGARERFVPQIYRLSQLPRFRSSKGWPGVIFTAYRSRLPLDSVFSYARRSGIGVVTVPVPRLFEWEARADGHALPREPLVFVHPVNDPLTAARALRAGADGIYTHYLRVPVLREALGCDGEASPADGPSTTSWECEFFEEGRR